MRECGSALHNAHLSRLGAASVRHDQLPANRALCAPSGVQAEQHRGSGSGAGRAQQRGAGAGCGAGL